MSKYCPECKMNFSDSFDECVYCGSSLLNGTVYSDKKTICNAGKGDVLNMTDEEILTTYQSYKKTLEERLGTVLSDKEFINGLKRAKTESCLTRSINDNNIENNDNSIVCPYCKSTNIKKITTTSKVIHTAMFGIFSISRNGKNFHCNQCSADF